MVSVLALATIGTIAEDRDVGTETVSQEDMIVVQIHCNQLLKAQNEAASEAASPGVIASGGARGPEAGEVGGDPAGHTPDTQADSGTGGAGVTVGQEDAPTVDLNAITLDHCRAAGLIN